MKVEPLRHETKSDAIRFLLRYEDYSLFLLGNLEAYGVRRTEEPYSGNFKIIRSTAGVQAVFCLTRAGNLIVQAEVPAYELILKSCLEEGIPIRGLIGEWNFSSGLWAYFKEKEVIETETFAAKEILYAIDLRSNKASSQTGVRLLEIDDYDEWKVLDSEYRLEQKLPDELAEKEKIRFFAHLVQNKMVWGLFVEDRLAVKAELNAKAGDLGQVGGVFTATGYRQKNLAKTLMLHLFYETKELLGLRKLLIFTGVENIPARRLYESLGVKEAGHFALLFGK